MVLRVASRTRALHRSSGLEGPRVNPATDPMTLLAGGMAQLQAVMLKQMTAAEKDKDGEQSPETVKPGTTTLPPLPAVRVETASVDIMDWLEMLTSPMSDLSDGSGLWWERVKSTANPLLCGMGTGESDGEIADKPTEE